jgi:hypothetical protein
MSAPPFSKDLSHRRYVSPHPSPNTSLTYCSLRLGVELETCMGFRWCGTGNLYYHVTFEELSTIISPFLRSNSALSLACDVLFV